MHSLASLIDIGDCSLVRVEDDLSVIKEDDLNDLITKSEYDGMLGPHPFLHIGLLTLTLSLAQIN